MAMSGSSQMHGTKVWAHDGMPRGALWRRRETRRSCTGGSDKGKTSEADALTRGAKPKLCTREVHMTERGTVSVDGAFGRPLSPEPATAASATGARGGTASVRPITDACCTLPPPLSDGCFRLGPSARNLLANMGGGVSTGA